MILGRVLDSIVSTVKHESLSGQKLLLVQPVTGTGSPSGELFVALDAVDAGPGDLVVVCIEGTGCRQIAREGRESESFPVNHVIAGFVDQIA